MNRRHGKIALLMLGLLAISCVMVSWPGQSTPDVIVTVTADILPTTTVVPTSTPLPQSTIGIVIPGNTTGWLRTGIWLRAGDKFSIRTGGTINIWPNCESTKTGAGYPNLDCKEVTEIGPEGTLVFEPAKLDYPYPDGGIAALVGRVGDVALPFLAGTEGAFTATADGFLQFAVNDIESLNDNQGEFVAQVTIPYVIAQSIAAAAWQDTGIILQAGDQFTIEASGKISMWPNCAATKVERGYPDIDCAETNVSPAGTDIFAPGLEEYPLPSQNTMALIARVGNDPAFLVGEGGDFTTEDGGPLLLATNDTIDWKKDDQGMFTIVITVAGNTVQLTIH